MIGVGEVVGRKDFLEACFDVVHPSGVPVIVGRTYEEGSRDPSGGFHGHLGLGALPDLLRAGRVRPRDGEAGRESEGIRAEYQHLLVQEYEDEYGRVHPSEDVIESWVEAGFEVRVVREGIRGGGGGSNRGLLHGVRPALTDFKSAVARPWLRVLVPSVAGVGRYWGPGVVGRWVSVVGHVGVATKVSTSWSTSVST